MKIDAKKLKDANIRITEEVHGALLEAPIDLTNLDGEDFDAFQLGSYDVDLDAEEVYSDGCEILFSVYKDGERVLESVPFDYVRDYLKERLG